jgi:hypothetical protein
VNLWSDVPPICEITNIWLCITGREKKEASGTKETTHPTEFSHRIESVLNYLHRSDHIKGAGLASDLVGGQYWDAMGTGGSSNRTLIEPEGLGSMSGSQMAYESAVPAAVV